MPEPDEIAFAGVAAQADLVRAGELSSRELTELVLERIGRLDPELRAFRAVWADAALTAADQADARRRGGDDRPLLGVPLAIKDDMDVRGQVTGMGSIAQRTPAAADAELVRRLRDAGAVLVGKTNVPELMTMPATETTWYGATHNPWDPDRTPGGSSGGSGAAVAAGLVAGATASDGAGSIRIPACCCGLVGLKPTAGRVPTPPHWGGLSTYGFLARRTADVALLHAVADDRWAAADPPGRLRIAVAINVPLGARKGPDAAVLDGVESVGAALRDLGHETFEAPLDFGRSGLRVIARFLRGIHDSAAEVERPDRLGARVRGLARMGGLIPAGVVARARAAAEGDRARLGAIYGRADVVLTPVINELPMRIGRLEGMGAQRALDAILAHAPLPSASNHTGEPAIAVPAPATAGGVPLGVQLLGPRDADARLLALAAQLEGAVGWADRIPSGFAG